MAVTSLAVKYRPKRWEDVTEQGSVKEILQNQLDNDEVKHAYLFCGGAGTGKTTSARIFANEINKGQGNPIELDAASNNSVDDIRAVIEQSKTKSLNSEYKIFILDEVHMLSNGAWNAMLKVLEEPPAKSIFIMCTTDPQKIPKTILSRVQRYEFQRISQQGIVNRLRHIIDAENADLCDRCGNEFYDIEDFLEHGGIEADDEALEYISKIADGGMRDAITMLDKCLAYNTLVTLENVVKALGTTNYDIMFDLTDALLHNDGRDVLTIINEIHSSGKDLKLFIKTYISFVLDICKYSVLNSFNYLQIPSLYESELKKYGDYEFDNCHELLKLLIRMSSEMKWETNPKSVVESTLLVWCFEGNKS